MGVTTSDDGVGCLLSTDCETGKARDGTLKSARDGDTSACPSAEGSPGSDSSSSSESNEAQDTPLPAYVLAGMGLIHQPGFEMSNTMGARLQDEFARAVQLGSGVDSSGHEQKGEAAGSVVAAQRAALAYSRELSATHEAVIALLAARPPCFNAAAPPCTPDMAVPPGGEPTTGVSDEVERDQNRVLNNLIETLFAYKGIVEKGLGIVPKCSRASQAKIAKSAREADEMVDTLTSSALRFLARSGDMLHVWGLDPVLYSPIFPGVRALVQAAVHRAADVIGSQSHDRRQNLERAVVASLTRTMVTRVPDDYKWVLPLAALALTSPGDLPDNGWWDTCVALVDDQHEKIETGGSTSRLKLAKLFKMVMSADKRAEGVVVKDQPKPVRSSGDDEDGLEARTEETTEKKVVNPGLAQVRKVVESWLEFDEAKVPISSVVSDAGHDCADDESEDDDDDGVAKQGIKLSPQQWDLGFDTSGWAGDRGAAAVAALARDRCILMDAKVDVEGANRLGGDESGSDAFFSTLSQLWSAATSDRAMMSVVQAAEATAFRRDKVLRRLVLMETTMNSVFARLPAYVMCEAGRWSEWMVEIRCALHAVDQGGDSATVGWLRFLLSHPPPAFESKTDMGNDASSTTPSSSSSADGDSDSGNGSSSSSNRGSDSDEEGAKEKQTADSPDAQPLAAGAGPQEALPPHNKVRRDSRERMKIKLGILDELGMAVGAGESENDMPAEVKEEFNARARSLFGISTSQTRGVISAKKLPPSIAAAGEAENTKERSRSGPADGAAKAVMMASNSSPGIDTQKEDHADEGEECKFITFVAESFRPQRDNSDWHREVTPDPIPQPVSSDATSVAAPTVADQGPIESPELNTAVTNKSGKSAADRDDTVDTGQELEAPPTGSPQSVPDGALTDVDSSPQTFPEHVVIEPAYPGRGADTQTGEVTENDDGVRYDLTGVLAATSTVVGVERCGPRFPAPKSANAKELMKHHVECKHLSAIVECEKANYSVCCGWFCLTNERFDSILSLVLDCQGSRARKGARAGGRILATHAGQETFKTLAAYVW